MTTLDGARRTLDADMVVIDDADGPTSIAGVMGGARSEVHDDTTRVLMEAATWDGPNIQRTSAQLGLRSEASGRFEKGLSPEQALEAQVVATRLMVELSGARLVGGHDRRRRRRAPAPCRSDCATRASSGCSASPIAARASRGILDRARLRRDRRPRTGST